MHAVIAKRSSGRGSRDAIARALDIYCITLEHECHATISIMNDGFFCPITVSSLAMSDAPVCVLRQQAHETVKGDATQGLHTKLSSDVRISDFTGQELVA
jgi:hypothetical protein